jgi:hypothetical protein
VFEELVLELVAERRRQAGGGSQPPAADADPEALGQMFLDQMDVYRAYWRDDPAFDATNTRAAAPDLPSPPLDDETIRRLCRFAIDNRFRWPPPGRRRPVSAARPLLEAAFGEAEWMPPATAEKIGLAATGPGGGQWTVSIDEGRPVSLHIGLPAADAPTVTVAADSLVELGEGRRRVLDVLGALAPSPARRGLVTA